MTPPLTAEPASLGRRALGVYHTAEDLLASLALAFLVVLPLAEIVLRPVLVGGIPGAIHL